MLAEAVENTAAQMSQVVVAAAVEAQQVDQHTITLT
jgi:hypothetical protein